MEDGYSTEEVVDELIRTSPYADEPVFDKEKPLLTDSELSLRTRIEMEVDGYRGGRGGDSQFSNFYPVDNLDDVTDIEQLDTWCYGLSKSRASRNYGGKIIISERPEANLWTDLLSLLYQEHGKTTNPLYRQLSLDPNFKISAPKRSSEFIIIIENVLAGRYLEAAKSDLKVVKLARSMLRNALEYEDDLLLKRRDNRGLSLTGKVRLGLAKSNFILEENEEELKQSLEIAKERIEICQKSKDIRDEMASVHLYTVCAQVIASGIDFNMTLGQAKDLAFKFTKDVKSRLKATDETYKKLLEKNRGVLEALG